MWINNNNKNNNYNETKRKICIYVAKLKRNLSTHDHYLLFLLSKLSIVHVFHLYSLCELPIKIPNQVKRVNFRCPLIFFFNFKYGTKASSNQKNTHIHTLISERNVCFNLLIFAHTSASLWKRNIDARQYKPILRNVYVFLVIGRYLLLLSFFFYNRINLTERGNGILDAFDNLWIFA